LRKYDVSSSFKSYLKKNDCWLPDEAASIYKKAHSVICMECHSPIIAEANGTPCFYLRQPQDTVKGQMWYVIGLDDWLFEIEETSGQDIIDQLNQVFNHYQQAEQYLKAAKKRQASCMIRHSKWSNRH